MNSPIKTFVHNQTNVYYISPFDIDNTNIHNIDNIAIAYLLWCCYDTTIIITKLYVNHNYVHQGYGTCLLKHTIKHATDSNTITKIELDDMSDNVWNTSKNIYVKCGFSYVNVYPFPEMELILPVGKLKLSFENMKLNNI